MYATPKLEIENVFPKLKKYPASASPAPILQANPNVVLKCGPEKKGIEQTAKIDANVSVPDILRSGFWCFFAQLFQSACKNAEKTKMRECSMKSGPYISYFHVERAVEKF